MKRYKVDLEESEISWTGIQPVKKMSGKVFFKAGMVCTDQGKLTEAEFIIDMQSIQATDEKLEAEGRKQLTEDLKSIHFFNSDIYPTCTLKTKKIKTLSQEEIEENDTWKITNPTHEVSALLTIKDITHSIDFPVKIAFIKNHIKVNAEFKIERTLWGINYMTEESYGVKKIDPYFVVKVKMTVEGIDEMD
jgi:polyisoprenoid-binding protein YceI